MSFPRFDIGRKGRRWTKEEIPSGYHELCPEKLELIEGKLLWSEEDRLKLLASFFAGWFTVNRGRRAGLYFVGGRGSFWLRI